MFILRQTAAAIGPGLQRYFAERLKVEQVRGLHLEFDAYWMAWIRHYFRSWESDDLWWAATDAEDFFFNHAPPDWKEHCRRMGYPEAAKPIVVRVIFRSPDDFSAGFDLAHSYEGFPIVYDSRPPAVGVANSILYHAGSSVGRATPDTAGTLGGFLRDSNAGTHYAVSCAHVMGGVGSDTFSPGPAEKPGGNKIARVALSQLPAINNSDSCNNRTHSSADSLDLAIAAFDPRVHAHWVYPGFAKPNAVTSFNGMKSGDHVVFFGKTSGRVDCEIGSLCIFHEIDIEKQPRCFGDIFTLTWPKPWYFNTALAKPGDSGAWILRSRLGFVSWDGMVFACDGATAYACFADNIMNVVQSYNRAIVLSP